MRLTVSIAAFVTFSLVAGVAHGEAGKPTFQLTRMTWVFKKDGARVRESVDYRGNYVARTFAGKELDHGTVVTKGTRACFTSRVDKSGQICWTIRPLNVGQSMISVSDKGEKLRVTRVKYVPMKAST